MVMMFSAHARSRARRFALQALYQWDLSKMELADIKRQFLDEEDFSRADKEYFTELLNNIPGKLEIIDSGFSGDIGRSVDGLDPVERATLRIAVYELMFREDVPCRVIINEAVTLAKKFGADQGHTFVNGVLDKVARRVRPADFPGTKERANGT